MSSKKTPPVEARSAPSSTAIEDVDLGGDPNSQEIIELRSRLAAEQDDADNLRLKLGEQHGRADKAERLLSDAMTRAEKAEAQFENLKRATSDKKTKKPPDPNRPGIRTAKDGTKTVVGILKCPPPPNNYGCKTDAAYTKLMIRQIETGNARARHE